MLGAAGTGAPTAADTAKVQDPAEDPWELQKALQGSWHSPQRLRQAEAGLGRCFPSLLGEDELSHVVIMQQDVQYLNSIK